MLFGQILFHHLFIAYSDYPDCSGVYESKYCYFVVFTGGILCDDGCSNLVPALDSTKAAYKRANKKTHRNALT